MKLIFTTGLILFWTSVNLFAQDFLTIQPDVRNAALGDVSVALSDNGFAFYNNAAAPLFEKQKLQAGISYSPWLRDIASGYSLTALGGSLRFHSRHVCLFGFRYYQEPKNDLTASTTDWGDYPFIAKDENNNPINRLPSAFQPRNFAIDLGYGYKLTPHTALALAGRYATTDWGDWGKARAIAFDLSVYSRLKIALCDSSFLTTGIKLSNLGFSSGDFDYDLPAKAGAGANMYLPFFPRHTLLFTLDCSYRFAPSQTRSFETGLGAEYTFRRLVALRGGYHAGSNQGYDYGTAGIGLYFYRLQAHVSYLIASSHCPLRNTYRIGLTFAL